MAKKITEINPVFQYNCFVDLCVITYRFPILQSKLSITVLHVTTTPNQRIVYVFCLVVIWFLEVIEVKKQFSLLHLASVKAHLNSSPDQI